MSEYQLRWNYTKRSKKVNRFKNWKATGVDDINVELLKNGRDAVINKLTKICNTAWETGQLPRDWQDGIIIPLPKKGNLSDCNNWRGVTLLSVPGKVMASVTVQDQGEGGQSAETTTSSFQKRSFML